MRNQVDTTGRRKARLVQRPKAQVRPLDARMLALVNGADAIIKLNARIAMLEAREAKDETDRTD